MWKASTGRAREGRGGNRQREKARRERREGADPRKGEGAAPGGAAMGPSKPEGAREESGRGAKPPKGRADWESGGDGRAGEERGRGEGDPRAEAPGQRAETRCVPVPPRCLCVISLACFFYNC